MKTLFNKSDLEEILGRVNKLTPTTKALWGKMNVSQMLAHCVVGMKSGTGDIKIERPLFAKILGGFFKKGFVGPKPFPRNSPTGKEFIVGGEKEFNTEKELLISLINKFYMGGENNVTKHEHGFVGKLTPTEWGVVMYKHLDHHLNQFGV